MANKRTTRTRTNLSTFGTDLGSVVRSNLNKFNSLPFSFVLDKTLQLKETPITNPIIHSPSEISSSNPFEIFHNNLISIKLGNDCLANVMIYPSHKPSLSSRNLFEKSSGTSSAFALEFTSQVFEFPFNLLDLGGIEELSVRRNSEIVYSEVNAQNLLRNRASSINLFGECEKEEAFAFAVNPQKAFINFPTEIIFEAGRNSERNFNPSFDCGDTQDVVFEGSRTGEVISDRTEFNNWFSLSFLNNSTRLFDAGNSKLRRKSENSQILINKRMEFNIISNLHFPSFINTELHSFFVGSNSVDNLFTGAYSNFGCCSISHTYLSNSDFKYLTEGISPPKPKRMGIRDARVI